MDEGRLAQSSSKGQSMDLMRLELRVAYKGTRFAGWQLQKQATSNSPKTIQGCLEEAFVAILGQPCRVQGAGRTDAGVHALAQGAHADVPLEKAGINWLAALNHHLPRDISVTMARPAAKDFHARFSAIGKTYSYHFWLERGWVLPQRRDYVWRLGRLDTDAMRVAAAHFVGEHDFKAFQNQGSEVKTTIRTVHTAELIPSDDWPELALRVSGSGFLKQMVRNMAGALAAVGQARIKPAEVVTLLESRDRTMAPATAPAKGLTLLDVAY